MDNPKQDAPTTKALLTALQRNWRVEMEGAATYRYLAEREVDPSRKRILLRLADGEAHHAERWAERLQALGADVPAVHPPHVSWLTGLLAPDVALRRIENEEESHIKIYEEQARQLNDAPSLEIIHDAVRDEKSHAQTLRAMTSVRSDSPRSRLDRILKVEKWHTTTGSWLGDAIYGANDGLGAVFGIVSGVAGATENSRQAVLLAGLAGAIASALSMGSGAYLSTKSKAEIHQAEVAREKREVEESPDEETEELELFYQLKGLSEDDAKMVVTRLLTKPERFLEAMAQEELGISEERAPNPLVSALSASVSTFFGAIIPVLPFFFIGGITAVILAAIISLVAHFAVGAAKTLVTGRSIIISGGEMTVIGAIEGVVTYGIGILIAPVAASGGG